MPDTRTPTPARTGFLCDVLSTAVEGGIGYWSQIVRAQRGVPVSTPGWSCPDLAALAWTSVTVVDTETDREHTITLATLTTGLNRLTRGPVTGLSEDRRHSLAWANRHNDAGACEAPADVTDIDADLADCAVQVATFGAVLYS
jgi:hypothetical protein